MSITTIVTFSFILLGAVILLKAILGTRKIMELIVELNYHRKWRILFILMLVFFFGYLLSAYLVLLHQESNHLLVIVGILFLLVSIFVYIVVKSGWHTILDLKKRTSYATNHAKMLQASQKELRFINKKLLAQNKGLERFTYIASHDLQEPLRTINSFIGLFKEEYSDTLDEHGRLYLSYISHSSSRMSELIKSLLDHTRIGREKKIEPVSCNQLVQEVLDDLKILIDESKAQIEIGKLPEFNAYKVELKQLFQNLINNAIKFRKPGVDPILHIGAEFKKNRWIFSVRDNGIGIEEKYLERIFEIFQRLHNRQEYEGTGIGLAHCKRIVELHNGTIWVESKPNKGSTFYFSIQS